MSWDIHPLSQEEVPLVKWWIIRTYVEERLRDALPVALRSHRFHGYCSLFSCSLMVPVSVVAHSRSFLLFLNCFLLGYSFTAAYLCAAIFLRLCLDVVCQHPENFGTAHSFWTYWSQCPRRLFVCRVGDRLAGCVAVSPLDEHEQFELRRLRVDPEFRQCGVAAELVRRAEEFSKSQGARVLRLSTSQQQRHTVEFYVKQRYRLAYRRVAFRHGGLPGLPHILLTFDKAL